ncbi:sulfotransferase [Acidomonas methanolica]|nr:sulfotransferase [Acidomonas methanolica]
MPSAARTPGLRKARMSLERGRLSETRALAMAELLRTSSSGEARFLLGVSEAMLGNVREGLVHLREATILERSAEYQAQLARWLLLVQRDGEARDALRKAEECLSDGERADAMTRDTMGCVYARLGRHRDSLSHFQAAVSVAPQSGQFRYNHAVALSFVGETVQSERAFEALLARDPGNARAHHGLAGLRRQSAESNHIPRLRAARNATRDPEARLLLGYALSKELEDVGEAQESFRCLLDTNTEHRARISYDFASDAEIFDAIEASWSQFASAPVTAPATQAPIFIIGMPRTGTTLVDRILSSHPEVVSAGELQAFPLAVKAASCSRTRNVLDRDTILHAAGKDLGPIGHSYLDRAAPHVPENAARFIDKFPGNFHYAGLIARALPNARIICLRRHPMDTVVSNFKNLFATTSQYYQYSYDLADIARYYVRFDQLMRFWHTAMPRQILDVHYEDLVNDQESATRKILAHCSLPWSEACLTFYDNATPVSTPSAAQVRRPIYRDALARWRRHERELGPALQVFDAAGIDLT